MSDKEDKEQEKVEAVNTAIEKTGKHMEKQKDTFRLTKGDKFDFKHYASGWKGGSRGRIETFGFAGIGNYLSSIHAGIGKFFDFKGYIDSYKSDGILGVVKSYYENKIVDKGAMIGAINGAKLFSQFAPNPAWKAYLGLAGAFVGGLAGVFGTKNTINFVEEKIKGFYSDIKGILGNSPRNKLNDGPNGGGGKGGNYTGKGKTGGIEFEIPKPIKNFSKNLFFNE